MHLSHVSGRVIRGAMVGMFATVLAIPGGASIATASPPHTPATGAAASPRTDDGTIAYVKAGDIYTILPDGTGMTLLASDGTDTGPVFSPDGGRIAYVRTDEQGNSDLWIMDANGTAQRQITSGGDVLRAAPSWSPDGTRLAFGGPCVPTEGDPNACDGFPDGKALRVIDSTSTHGLGHMLKAELSGCFDSTLFVDGRSSWSPSGDSIVFYSTSYACTGEDQYILLYRFADHSITSIDETGAGGAFGTYGNPAFSPDGHLVAYDDDYSDVGGGSHVGIRVLRVDNHQPVPFRQSANDRQLAFAPSQTLVALVRVPKNRIVIADIHGRHRTFLTRGSQPSWQRFV